jgi:hypothetical protein
MGYAGYESYRPWLRDEFSFRCVYCLTRESWTRFSGAYAIDHFQPVVSHPNVTAEYENLLYACIPCNLIKADSETPDPLLTLLESAVEISKDGVIRASTSEAARLIELLGLDGTRMTEFRELWMGIIGLAARFDPDLYRRLMGYPSNLPDLSTLHPPAGNARPEGVANSHLQRQRAGTLPDTY